MHNDIEKNDTECFSSAARGDPASSRSDRRCRLGADTPGVMRSGFPSIAGGTGAGSADHGVDLGAGRLGGADTDLSLARSTLHHLGNGRFKHVKTRYAFMQAIVREKKLSVEKFASARNPSDVGAKALNASSLPPCMRKADFVSAPPAFVVVVGGAG